MTETPQTIAPRNHQKEAQTGLWDVLGRGPRAQAHMCCGSGKTYAQAFLAQAFIEDVEDPAPVIMACFVPNRTLVQQNARNFRAVFGDSVELLGVCSDADLTGLVSDSDTPAVETTTDPDRIEQFLRRTGRPRLVISTYHSAPTLRAALAVARGPQADLLLGLFDEAHRTAGDKTEDDLFAYALSDDNFPISKRAFFTATPRISEGRKTPTYSMSNPEIFGPVAYTYSFQRGITDGNVVDYDLWVPIITHSELANFMKDQGLEGEDRAALALIALKKVMEKTGQSRFLAYRQRVATSQAFAKEMKKVFPLSFVGHVDGTTPGKEREAMMKALGSGDALLTNCKAFVEGVDVPGLQGVLFVDARKSVVDVVQAVGRLSRPDPEDPGKRGSIIAPILSASADPEAIDLAARTSGFQTLVQVAQALRANDDALEEDILQKSRAEGRGEEITQALHGMEILIPEDSGLNIDDIAQAITVAAMEHLRDTFATQVGRLERFIAQHGYLPARRDDAKLATWIASVRNKHLAGELEPAHADLLDTVEEWAWIGERTPADKIAGHIRAFRDRRQAMPSLKRGTGAEADLHAHLMEGQESYLRYGSGADALTTALEEENLLFFAEEVLGKRAQVSGRFDVKSKNGTHEVWFHPRADKNRKTIPVFRSGHTVAPRPFLVHTGRVERERLIALGKHHSVRITLVRAGIVQDPFRDARVLDWHAGTAKRGETSNTSKNSFGWLLARLMDRKASGRPAYSFANLAAKRIRANKPATILNSDAPEATIEEVLELISRVRQAMILDKIDQEYLDIFDNAPGFSWIEQTEEDTKVVEICAAHVARTLGAAALYNPRSRTGDTGLSNTLRALDQIAEDRPGMLEGLKPDLRDALREHLSKTTAGDPPA
jgi:superfamily II DNA or RNA helicase